MPKYIKSLISVSLLAAGCMAMTAEAKASVNDVQLCQAQLEFIDSKLASIKKYNSADVKKIRKAMSEYNTFLQAEHIKPGLLAYTGGDKAKADMFQAQIDTFKSNQVTAMHKRYHQDQIFGDQALSVNECYKKAPMSSDKTPMMKDALETMVKLAQQN